MRNHVKRHWRIIIPIIVMIGIFCLFAPPSSNVAPEINLGVILFALLGVSWYYYLRVFGCFTPGFTTFFSLLLVIIFAMVDTFYYSFTLDCGYIIFLTAVGLIGIIAFALLYCISRTPAQKKVRRKQVENIWKQNTKLLKKIIGKR